MPVAGSCTDIVLTLQPLNTSLFAISDCQCSIENDVSVCDDAGTIAFLPTTVTEHDAIGPSAVIVRPLSTCTVATVVVSAMTRQFLFRLFALTEPAVMRITSPIRTPPDTKSPEARVIV